MNTKTIEEPSRAIPITDEPDVLVCGGGPAGVGAALAAARQGASVTLVENQICLGGMATSGMVNRLGPYHDQKNMILGGIPREVLDTLIERGLAQQPAPCAPGPSDYALRTCSLYWLVFDPEGMKVALDELLTAAGVRLFFDTRVTRTLMTDNTVTGVVIENKSGRSAILAHQIIDATGDADVAAGAEVPFQMGRDKDGLMQPFTIFFKCLNIDWPHAFSYVCSHAGELSGKALEEIGRGGVLVGTDNYLHPEETYFNCLHEQEMDSTKADDISRAAISLRRKMWDNLHFIRKHIPGCENASLISSASAMGVRESRRITGEYTLTIDDVINARSFEDQVYRYACFVDIHPPKPGAQSEYADRNLAPGESYGVPYRCFLPKGVENLLVAGRSLSATHEALASVRMMPSCMAMGQAVGTAAALCVDQQLTPRTLSTEHLQDTLKAVGIMGI